MKKTICSLIFTLLCFSAYAQWFNWEARMGNTAADLVSTADQMKQKGFTPGLIHAHHINGQTRFSTLWKLYPEKAAWELRTDLSKEDLQQAANYFTNKSYVPFDVSVYNVNGETRYSTIWSEDHTTPFQTWTGIKAADFKQTIDSFTVLDYRITDVDGYTENGQRYFSGIWKKFSGLPWHYAFGFDRNTIEQSWKEAERDGYIPTSINVFEEGGYPVFSAIYVKVQNEKAKVFYQVEEARLQQLVDKTVEEGYAISDLDSYVLNGSVYYALVFSKAVQQNPAQQPVTSFSRSATQTAAATTTSSKFLAIAPVQQQTDVWCWLAVGEMIFRNLGVTNANPDGNYQCGIIGSLNFVHPVCASQCFNQACIIPSGSNYNTVRMLRDYALRRAGRVFTCTEAKEMSFDEIKNNIDVNKPILAGVSYYRRQYYGGAEHAVLITGYEQSAAGTYVIINDPFAYGPNNNPYLQQGGTMITGNQYKISLRSFTEGVFWHWSLSGIGLQ